ncbi:uncharacterized protein LOC112593677 [Melanaphis sacchari]|uniref:uncharacterized protein LOC112593677 n=1 Tax=Melanaphis sacchari TaxID=742174 RepID=UPI000DC13129|nr:uncharacterized protein LOC112593677 [Melanaphis sacchari]
MTDSIMNNATIYKKTFTYIPPTPPLELIESTNYTLNFVKHYLDRELVNVESTARTSEEMTTFIKNIRDDHIIANTSKHDINFISQLKMNAFTQLTEHSIQRWNREMSSKLFNGNVIMISLTSSPSIMADNIFDSQN